MEDANSEDPRATSAEDANPEDPKASAENADSESPKVVEGDAGDPKARTDNPRCGAGRWGAAGCGVARHDGS